MYSLSKSPIAYRVSPFPSDNPHPDQTEVLDPMTRQKASFLASFLCALQSSFPQRVPQPVLGFKKIEYFGYHEPTSGHHTACILIAIWRVDDAANCVRFVKQSCQPIEGELRHTLHSSVPEFFRSQFIND